MRVLITGMRGTVGKALAAELSKRGHEALPWRREQVPIDQYQRMDDFVRSSQAQCIFHLAVASSPTGRPNEDWLVNYEWTSELAWIARVNRIPFVFLSTVMVFSDQAKGPFTPDTPPDAREGYGYQKRQAEERCLYQNPDSLVVRLGWQIGDLPEGNTMNAYLQAQMDQNGEIHASSKWIPSCSYLPDTAFTLAELGLSARERDGGIYAVEANNGYSFHAIAKSIAKRYGHTQWNIVQDDSFVFDQRQYDARVYVRDLTQHFDLD